MFVGRRPELARLTRVLRGDPGEPSTVLVIGDAGIGKTRLLAEVLREAPDLLVLGGACLPLTESLPFGAIIDALAALTTPSNRPVLDQALARSAPYVRPQIAALVPALSTAAEPPPSPGDDRMRLFSAVRDLLGSLGAARRTALVVEDLHWADSGTLDLLTLLVRGLPPGTVLLSTSRRDELPAASPALDWLSATSRLAGVEAVHLAPLAQEDVADLVSALVDEAPTATSRVSPAVPGCRFPLSRTSRRQHPSTSATPDTASPRASSTFSGCSALGPPTPRSADACT